MTTEGTLTKENFWLLYSPYQLPLLVRLPYREGASDTNNRKIQKIFVQRKCLSLWL